MTPGVRPAMSGGVPGTPIAANYRDPPDPIELVALRVGGGKDEATRERAVRLVVHVKDTVWPGEHPRPEHDVHRPLVNAWLAAASGSPQRERCEAKARQAVRGGATDYAMFMLDVIGGHEEPGRIAGAAVAHLARSAQAVASYWVPNLIRLLDAAGFKRVEEDLC